MGKANDVPESAEVMKGASMLRGNFKKRPAAASMRTFSMHALLPPLFSLLSFHALKPLVCLLHTFSFHSHSDSFTRFRSPAPAPSSLVFKFVPQIIGFSRVFCTLQALYLATVSLESGSHYKLSMIFYLLSFVGDMFDGMAARKFNQSSKFGGVLDMVTDRCSTAVMLTVLTWIYTQQEQRLALTFLFILDISSHWMQMTSSYIRNSHHKTADANDGNIFLVRWYYSSKAFFGYCCVFTEVTYILLYVTHYCPSGDLLTSMNFVLTYLCYPACVIKNIVNVFQLAGASYLIAEQDVIERKKM